MPVELKQRLLSVSEYHKMMDAGIFAEDDRLELINGQIVYMSPIGSFHAAMVRKLDDLLHSTLRNDALISAQNPVSIPDFSEPEPDIAILKRREDYYAGGHPEPQDILLIIEVADSSLESDRNTKLPLYALAGIPAYWIINLLDQQIEMYHTPAGNIYKVREIATMKDRVSLDSLELDLAVKDIFG